ncbi:ribonuclease [Rummeliibacillus stabekisii]|uniref:Ribonuclease n=1 Tax=Rummeliibacillus stabekisii TaxID=241244 RepID=A0A143HHB6_9BACL|nr:ribonuclease [Rummeliibacillus stabekisii]
MDKKEKKKKKKERHFDITTNKGFIMGLIEKVKKEDIGGFGAQLAYFFLLSLFPMLLFIVTLLPYLHLSVSQVYTLLEEVMPDEIYSLTSDTLSEVLKNRHGGLLSIGILGTLWSASNGVNALNKSLNRSYDQEETRPFLKVRLYSLIFTILLIGLVVVALVLPVFGEQIGKLLFSAFGLENGFLAIWNKFRYILPPVVIFIVLTLMYWLMPNMKLDLKSVWVGALFSTLAWLIVSYGFSFYISNFSNYSATYGSIGGIIILMLWLYITGIILMVGGQVNALVQKRREIHESNKHSTA